MNALRTLLALGAGLCCATDSPRGQAATPRTDAPQLTVDLDSDAVEFGAAFTATVTRRYPASARPDALPTTPLPPLDSRRQSSAQRADGDAIVETVVFQCRAFALGDVEVQPAPLIVTTADGRQLTASAPPRTVRVHSILTKADDGRAELPGPLRALPAPRRWWPAALAAAVALAAGLFLARRRRPARHPSPIDRARARQQQLVTRAAHCSADEIAVEIAAIVRDELLAAAPTDRAATTAELTAAADATPRLRPLVSLLQRADAVRFARRQLSDAEGRALLEDLAAAIDQRAGSDAA